MTCQNNIGETPLHYACSNGYLDITQYLISEGKCDPSCENNDGWTPLHFACSNGDLKITQYLINKVHCNSSSKDGNGWTPLHLACYNKWAHIVKYLLSTGRVNPLDKNKSGYTALYFASQDYNIIKLFEPFEECRISFPVHMFTKLILIGNSGVGKTTIAKCLVHLANATNSDMPSDCVTDVELLTAGIIPHYIQSKQLGNFIMYDFAGQQEYYSSHTAVLEQVMQRSAAIFLCMVDLSKNESDTCKSLQYWLSFIDNACTMCTAEATSHVVIVGSHSDQVASSEEVKSKSLLLEKIADKKVMHQRNSGCISMDCRYARSNSHDLINLLTNSQKAINASQPSISYYCHVVYAFLHKLNVKVCTLHELFTAVSEENDASLPNDQAVLTEILTTLNDKGLVLFIHQPHSQNSWIVVKTEILLKEINGTLFAPEHFTEHHDIASNTGIVRISNLEKVFPMYNIEMLIEFLISLYFCQPMDPLVFQYTNLESIPSDSTTARDLLFFPGLVEAERPKNLFQQGKQNLKFGWCLRCMDPNEFLSSRFLHVLLLSVAYKFPLKSRVTAPSVGDLHRICTVWRNGIFWRNLGNITTVIELLDNNRYVLMAMSCEDTDQVDQVKHAKLRSSLVALVCHLQQRYCSSLNICEFVVSPKLVQQYPLNTLPDSDLFEINLIAQSMLCREKGVPSYKDGRGYLKLEELPFEPYHQLSFSSVRQLINPVMADQPVPDSILQEVETYCSSHKPLNEFQKISEVKEYLDKLSIFTGRNLLVSCVAVRYIVYDVGFDLYRRWLGRMKRTS